MKVTLEYPYTLKYKTGYLVKNGENRKHVLLVGDAGEKTTTSYARYLMSVNLKRVLTDSEEVDHINNDKTDDRLCNLQLLTPTENRKKQARAKGRKVAKILCPTCGTVFIRRTGNTQAVSCKFGQITCCSKKCSNVVLSMSYSEEQKCKISEITLLEVFSLSE